MEWEEKVLILTRQSELLSLNRSGLYYEAAEESEENLWLMRKLDQLYTAYPYYGTRKMTACLHREGVVVNRKRVGRLLRKMGLYALYEKPHLSQGNKAHKKYPYLLKDRTISRPCECFATDITYIPMAQGFLYLVAVMDWHSRYVVSWEISNSLDTGFCLVALERALSQQIPEIFNTDQGCQFTSAPWIERLTQEEI